MRVLTTKLNLNQSHLRDVNILMFSTELDNMSNLFEMNEFASHEEIARDDFVHFASYQILKRIFYHHRRSDYCVTKYFNPPFSIASLRHLTYSSSDFIHDAFILLV
jgi:hypothetical protein